MLDKYWVILSGYFRLATTVALVTGITDVNLLHCHSLAEVNVNKKISTLEYNNRAVYECFNNPFTAKSGSPDLHLLLITLDDRSCMHKRARYTPDLLPYAISFASENYVSTLTAPSDLPHLLPSGDPNTLHVMNKLELLDLVWLVTGYLRQTWGSLG